MKTQSEKETNSSVISRHWHMMKQGSTRGFAAQGATKCKEIHELGWEFLYASLLPTPRTWDVVMHNPTGCQSHWELWVSISREADLHWVERDSNSNLIDIIFHKIARKNTWVVESEMLQKPYKQNLMEPWCSIFAKDSLQPKSLPSCLRKH